ncbi:DNA-binding transcriptional response regulator, NtrC family, contains REC, AAA-type ATPase, and a Fis-type DNA-binding domains [Maridesulfovibrio ferrireducens]|uniref:DNA-binding transcriptional response regulator, NtrC family, contains REC, AAA-type ATPase, and a Fis-type DNA-binding domains n=1 Tax=Maridesulfovibrio ferrireducens TaxID=246191 RepID=A0A1G9L8A2_9BACT|nr:sigma-54 dependent transcriptional regulator [Maridesulfovibrio ferrireducens]SDL58200.1 DNA-binding transcriptional response regulator, NtrC family, contains REC, AAA-type ATPase, and a Fis-type DNA-binding domains [Maridesulfovibrio ferrireducens]
MAESSSDNNSNKEGLRNIVSKISRKLGLRGKLLLTLLPSILAILLFTGYTSYRVADEYVNIALTRTVKVQTLAIVHEVEQYMDTCRTDLLFFAQGDMQSNSLRDMMERHLRAGGNKYFELAYLPASGGKPVVLVQRNGLVNEMSLTESSRIEPNPLLELKKMNSLKQGEVQPSQVMEVVYPLPDANASNLHVRTHVIRFYTYFPGNHENPPGILFLSVEASQIRNILSLYNSEQSPLWAFPRSQELRFSYLLNTEGWILFQSASIQEKDKELTTFLARENFEGTLGKQGHASAFRPNKNYATYWQALEKIKNNEYGLLEIAETDEANSNVKSYYFSYAPVNFKTAVDNPPMVYGGVVFVDRSQIPIIAGYKHFDVMLMVTIGTIALISFLILCIGKILTTPVLRLATRMNELSSLETLEEINLPYCGFDVEMLQRSINNIIRRVKQQVTELQAKDEAIFNVNKREPADLKRELETLVDVELSLIPEIIGHGPIISSLKSDILKAAQVDVDVLISGETGTGKQLVAEAIHSQSNRKKLPFVAINCGALDENLLLDVLFGHVKGAFSDAKTDRSGAFNEANGGTLFLDEIQSASPKVQQSLLRAIASRKIKPLGSDKEVDFNVRIIAATNVDIPSLIKQKIFREDLYYRLKVISIATPALREHPENIPLLSIYYLKQAEQLTGRTDMGISKGALSKLVSYQWSGNVRELVNCITRATVMAEGKIIQPEEIRLEGEIESKVPPSDVDATSFSENENAHSPVEEKTSENKNDDKHKQIETIEELSPLNERQNAAWPTIKTKKTVTRKEYQEMVGGRLPTRTAIYDLQDFVKREMLTKQGRGPSTRYVVSVK